MSDGLPRAAQFTQTGAVANMTGDVGGTNLAAVVNKIKGYTVSGAPSADGDVLSWNSGAGELQFGALSPAVGGDLSGSVGSATVVGIRGGTVSSGARADGNIMEWDNGGSQWAYVSPGGDVSGKVSALTVAKLQGRAVASTAPSDGQVLVWSLANNRWEPGAGGGGGTASWDAIYSADKSLTIDGAVLQWQQTINTGQAFRVYRNLATTDAALVSIESLDLGDAQAALHVTGKVTQSHTAPTSAIDAHLVSITSGGIDGTGFAGISAFRSTLTGATGDTNNALMCGFRADYTDDGGAGSQLPVGFLATNTIGAAFMGTAQLSLNVDQTNPAVYVQQDGTGGLFRFMGGANERLSLAVDGAIAHTTADATASFTAHQVNVSSGGLTAGTEVVLGLNVQPIGHASDAVGSTIAAISVGNFAPVGSAAKYAIVTGTGYDYGLLSQGRIAIQSQHASGEAIFKVSSNVASTADLVRFQNSTGQRWTMTDSGEVAHSPVNPSDSFTGYGVSVTSGGIDGATEWMRGIAVTLTGAVGDTNAAPLTGIRADFTGKNGGDSVARAFFAGDGWDAGFYSESMVEVNTSAADTFKGRNSGSGNLISLLNLSDTVFKVTNAGLVTHLAVDSGTGTSTSYGLTARCGNLNDGTFAYGMKVDADGSAMAGSYTVPTALIAYGATSSAGFGTGYGLGFYADNTLDFALFAQSAVSIQVASTDNKAIEAQHSAGLPAASFSTEEVTTTGTYGARVALDTSADTHTGKIFSTLHVRGTGNATGGTSQDFEMRGVNLEFNHAGAVSPLAKGIYASSAWDWSIFAESPAYWGIGGSTAFMRYQGNRTAGSGGNISTDNGATADMIRVNVDGTDLWIPAYASTTLPGAGVPSWDQIYAGDPNSNVLTVSGASDPFEINQTSTGIGFYVRRDVASPGASSPLVKIHQQNNTSQTQYALEVLSDDGSNEQPVFKAGGEFGNGYLTVSSHGAVTIQQGTGRILNLTGYSRLKCARIDYQDASGHSVYIAGNLGHYIEVGASTGTKTVIAATLLDIDAPIDLDYSGASAALDVNQAGSGSLAVFKDGNTPRFQVYDLGRVEFTVADATNFAMVLDQQGAGSILDIRRSGTSRYTMYNNGRTYHQATGIVDSSMAEYTDARSGGLGSGEYLVGHYVDLWGHASDDAGSQLVGLQVNLSLNSSAATTRRGIVVNGSWEYGIYSYAPVYVSQQSSTGAVPVLELQQIDADETFINFNGSSGADQTSSISTVQGDGSNVVGPKDKTTTAGWAFAAMVKVEIAGTPYYMALYSVAP